MNLLKPLFKLTEFFTKKTTRSSKRKKAKEKKAALKHSKPKKQKTRVLRKPQKTVTKKSKQPLVGSVTHYFPKVKAAVLQVLRPISVGDSVQIKGSHIDLKFKIKSMQINRIPIDSARKGEEIGLEVPSEVRVGDQVFLIK